MLFKKYPSIENSYKEKFIDAIVSQYPKEAGEPIWYVMEKVHGANYAFYLDYYPTNKQANIKVAKRSSFIAEKENFFGHEKVYDRLAFNMYQLSKHLGKDAIVYGELFGGVYAGESKGTIVQKGVQYHKYNDFMAFDIAKYIMSVDKVEFYTVEETITMCEDYMIPHVPVLFKGTLQECLEYENTFLTKVPELYGLPPIEGNFCGGVVIKPNQTLYLSNGDRVVIKNKNDKVKEIENKKSDPKPKVNTSAEVLQVVTEVHKGITKNRMDAVASKLGEITNFQTAMEALLLDAVEELAKPQYMALVEDDKKRVFKLLSKDLATQVKKVV